LGNVYDHILPGVIDWQSASEWERYSCRCSDDGDAYSDKDVMSVTLLETQHRLSPADWPCSIMHHWCPICRLLQNCAMIVLLFPAS